MARDRQVVMEEYRFLLEKVDKRLANVRNLVKWLHTETQWLNLPASKRFHCSHEGGLLEHSVNVATHMLKFRSVLAQEISEESCVIVGLFHDLGKIGGIDDGGVIVPRYLQSRLSEWQYNPEVIEIGLAERSLQFIAPFVPLSDAEVQAILCHDGQYVAQNSFIAHHETPLTLIAHYADYWSAHVIEDERDVNFGNVGIWMSFLNIA